MSQGERAAVFDRMKSMPRKVIDSLNGYQSAMPEQNSLILHIHEVLQYLNRRGCATFLTVAQLEGAAR